MRLKQNRWGCRVAASCNFCKKMMVSYTCSSHSSAVLRGHGLALGLPRWLSGKIPLPMQKTRMCEFEEFPWRRKWQPSPIFLPGESPRTEEPGGLQSMGSQRIGHDWATKHKQLRVCTGVNWLATQVETPWVIWTMPVLSSLVVLNVSSLLSLCQRPSETAFLSASALLTSRNYNIIATLDMHLCILSILLFYIQKRIGFFTSPKSQFCTLD